MSPSGRATATHIVIPYLVCWVLVLLLAVPYSLSGPDWCDGRTESHYFGDGMYDCEDYGDSLYLLVTTMHDASWGHVVPVTAGQRALVCLVSVMGYLWPLLALIAMCACAGQRALATRALAALLVAHVGLALLGNLAFAGILTAAGDVPFDRFDHPYADHEDWTSGSASFASCFYLAWQTFHMRAYGEIFPRATAGHVICLFIAMAGNLAWVVPVLVVARRTVLDPGAQLFSSENEGEGGFRALLSKVLRSILLPYSACFASILILAGVYTAGAPNFCKYEYEGLRCGYGDYLLVLLKTFHGVTYGDSVPHKETQRAVAMVVAALGYLWRQVALVLLLRSIEQAQLAKRYAAALAGCFLGVAVLGCVVLAAVNAATAEPRLEYSRGGEVIDATDFGNSLYYVWMTYHGRAFGEMNPGEEAGEQVVGLLSAVAGNLAWIWPLLFVLRASLLQVVSAMVSVDPAPTVTPEVIGAFES